MVRAGTFARGRMRRLAGRDALVLASSLLVVGQVFQALCEQVRLAHGKHTYSALLARARGLVDFDASCLGTTGFVLCCTRSGGSAEARAGVSSVRPQRVAR